MPKAIPLRLFAVSCATFAAAVAYAQTLKIDENGRQIIEYDDGTWRYLDERAGSDTTLLDRTLDAGVERPAPPTPVAVAYSPENEARARAVLRKKIAGLRKRADREEKAGRKLRAKEGKSDEALERLKADDAPDAAAIEEAIAEAETYKRAAEYNERRAEEFRAEASELERSMSMSVAQREEYLAMARGGTSGASADGGVVGEGAPPKPEPAEGTIPPYDQADVIVAAGTEAPTPEPPTAPEGEIESTDEFGPTEEYAADDRFDEEAEPAGEGEGYAPLPTDAPVADAPGDVVPGGEAPTDQVPAEGVPADEAPVGEIPVSDVAIGDAEPDDAEPGDVDPGDVAFDDAALDEAPVSDLGDAAEEFPPADPISATPPPTPQPSAPEPDVVDAAAAPAYDRSGEGASVPSAPARRARRRARTREVAEYSAYDPAADTRLAPPQQTCAIASVGVDEFTQRRRVELKPATLIAYTSPEITNYQADKSLVTAEARLLELGKNTALLLDFEIRSKFASKEFGPIPKGSQLTVTMLDGTSVVLRNNSTKSTPSYDAIEKVTRYHAVYPISKKQRKGLERGLVDEVRVMWGTGFEDYPVYDLDLFRRQFACL